jgi:hypothetical protein
MFIAWDICCYWYRLGHLLLSAAIFIPWDICCYWYRLGHLLLLVSPRTSAAIGIAWDICCYLLLFFIEQQKSQAINIAADNSRCHRR